MNPHWQHRWTRRRQGTAAVEFLVAFPAFLLLSMFVLEMALMWSDRHVLHLATYEAARTLIYTDTKDIEANGGKVCWPENPSTDDERARKSEILGAVKTAAVRKTAMISPTVTYFAAGLPFLSGAGAAVDRALSDIQGSLPLGESRFVNAMKKYVLSLPTAWALTHPTGCEETGSGADGTVTVEMTYYRAPRMPFIGGFLWALRTSKLVEGASGGLLTLEVDPLDHFAVSPDLDEAAAIARVNEVRNALKDAVGLAKDMDWAAFGSGGLPFSQVPGLDQLDPIFQDQGLIDQAADELIGGIGILGTLLRNATSATTMLVYAVPESLRLIPMTVRVTMVKSMVSTGEEEDRWKGKAFLVAPFYHPDENKDDDAWMNWAHNMQKDHVDLLNGGDDVEVRR